MVNTIDPLRELRPFVTTSLMILRDLATCNNIPINIQLDNLYIHVTVGFGTKFQKHQSFYLQDLYEMEFDRNSVYTWIENAIKEIKEKTML